MIGAVSEFGKLGLTVIANTDAEVDALYERTIDVLRIEATMGHLPSGFEWLLSHGVELLPDGEQLVGYIGKAFGKSAQLNGRHPQREDRTVKLFHCMGLERSCNRGIRIR